MKTATVLREDGAVSDDGPSTSALWATAAWRAEALGWADERLAAAGLRRTGEPDQPRIRAWSTLLRFPVDAGHLVWLKACTPQAAHEVALLELLADRVPDAVVAPLAVDRERGWMLTADGGPVLRERVERPDLVHCWEQVVAAHSALQRRTVEWVPELLASGVPDLRPIRLAQEGARLLARDGAGPAVRQAVSEACARLAASPVPAALQHDDFHTGNVFFDDSGHARFFDWGDAYLGHPFSVMLIGLACLPHQHDLALEERQRERLVRAYLGPWSGFAPEGRLRQDLADALLVARLGRVLGWRRALSRASDAERAEWDEHPRHWLAEVRELATG